MIQANKFRLIDLTKWAVVLLLSGLLLIFTYELYVEEWLLARAEKRVQNSIQTNYLERKVQLAELLNFLEDLDLPPLTEIEFTGKENWYIHLSRDDSDSITFNLAALDHLEETTDYRVRDLEFLQDGRVKLIMPDTTVILTVWNWEGDSRKNDKYSPKLMAYLGLSDTPLEQLYTLLKNADTEAVFIHQDRSISIRYDGHSLCQYEYFVPSGTVRKVPDYYTSLGQRIFWGLRRSNLFCGFARYDK
ncbi:hypothetical protein [Flavilitoribacter nigricans]|uniref:Uncharacterized protein n=1 Tax=Flavilitoribacter nigricans (strain ATCC 23147 / DSM 23189 / NBRC 102662 / NCIMB 1420 / SS-2) TaxID=1122177 RepID=A0A2D0NAH4_FLAN2|nr:hypothetical protein [Flavilitoribacter nigricans]PHN05386.1 hypothetical protein CRP01_17900 [Flavilitoribacter nigricans DSM 23189 = NBRC 102662]